ncbi:sensor histidine kinase [Microvirga pudoricolor]|uniref:sensor histidine kinase n=1 Tax=Microvirga pudoricolor TaxID=2778729 RepID=UPI001950A26B|nr:histidine kinase dimerization/phosphoacceptor domain -containing protein [Microvirga pudoricolor]MBM6595038.1 PAS domain S-box protein [Microvirga pudoricolor]
MLIKTKTLDPVSRRSAKTASANPFQAAFESSLVPMLLLDAGQAGFPVIFTNKAFLRLTGRLGNRLMGKPFLAVLGTASGSPLATRIEQALGQGQGVETDVQQARRTGEPVWCRLAISPVSDRSSMPLYFTVSYFDLSDRLRVEDELQQSLERKALLLREGEHRVKNNLQVISSLVLLMARRIPDPNTRQALHNLTERISALTTVQRLLSSPGDMSRLDLKPFVAELASNALDLFPRGQVRLDMQVEDLAIPAAKAVPFALLLNEVVGNAAKHAFPRGRKGRLLIEARRQGSDLAARVTDDGVGIDPPGFDQGFGRILIDTLTRQLRGTVTWSDAGPGTQVDIVLPVDVDEPVLRG